VQTSLLDYELPAAAIARHPAPSRDGARLLVVDGPRLEHRRVRDLIELVPEGALVVLNDTRVRRARVLGERRGTGGKVEFLLLRRLSERGEPSAELWSALGRANKALRPGSVVEAGPLTIEVVSTGDGGELTVAVNLSTGEIDRPDLVADVEQIRRETGLPPGALKLEVTESDVMRDPDRAAVVLRSLRAAGAALALDDFGTGFSSLSYLTRLPFDTLKIDRYFVRTMATNEGSAKIVSSVVKLGQDLDMEVVAEGVENAGMARQLLALGCDYGQGFGYAPALSAQEAEVYLNESYVDGAAPVKARG